MSWARLALSGFVFFAPFGFVAGVWFQNPLWSGGPAVLLAFAWLLWLGARGPARFAMSTPGQPVRGWHALDLVVMFILAQLLASTAVQTISGGPLTGIRHIVALVLPCSAYFASFNIASRRYVRMLFLLIALAAFIVAVELLYEYWYRAAHSDIAPYEKLVAAYIQRLNTGTTAANVFHRPAGLIEHGNATGAFIGVGLLAALGLYLYTRQRILLFGCALFAVGLVLGASITALLATGIALAVMIMTSARRLPVGWVVMGVAVATVGSGLVISFGAASGHPTFQAVTSIYARLTEGRVFAGSNDPYLLASGTFDDYLAALKVLPWALFTGFGITSAITNLSIGSDDLFAFQLLGQHGLVGFLLLYSTPFVAMRLYHQAARTLEPRDRYLMLTACAITILLLVTTIHSGALQRKVLYAVFFLSLGIVRWYSAYARSGRAAENVAGAATGKQNGRS